MAKVLCDRSYYICSLLLVIGKQCIAPLFFLFEKAVKEKLKAKQKVTMNEENSREKTEQLIFVLDGGGIWEMNSNMESIQSK